MGKYDILKKVPREGFIKITREPAAPIEGSQKAALIRKGNELFNTGQFGTAKRIFLTTGYSDGLIRMGDYYLENGDPLEALRMYWIAPSPSKKEMLIEQIAGLLQGWLQDD